MLARLEFKHGTTVLHIQPMNRTGDLKSELPNFKPAVSGEEDNTTPLKTTAWEATPLTADYKSALLPIRRNNCFVLFVCLFVCLFRLGLTATRQQKKLS